MKTVLSVLLLTMLGRPVFGEDLKIYAAAAFKAPLADIVSQLKPLVSQRRTPAAKSFVRL
jgi:hypothetical protein